MIITQQRPAASNEISSGFGKGLCSSLKQDQKCWLRAVAVTEALANATCSFRTTTGKDIEIYSYHSFHFHLENVLRGSACCPSCYGSRGTKQASPNALRSTANELCCGH